MSLTEEQYLQLLGDVPGYSLAVDDDGVVRFVDADFQEYFDVDSEEVVGREISSLIYDEDSERMETALAELSADGDEEVRIEVRIQTSDHEWGVFEAVGRQTSATSPVSGYVFSLRDITERKKRERELRAQNERLDQFAGVVSHDIRSPLQVARGHLSQAELTDDPESFEKVEQAHARIEAIITDVLELARQGAGVDETESVSLSAVARAAWETVDTKTMELVIQSDREIEADPDRLQQLFENLFRNAVEHAGPDVTVTVGAREVMGTTTRAGGLPTGFVVSDDGSGLPEREDGSVFDSGFSTANDGTGFGLMIVKQIAHAHDWKVEADESLDGGAKFVFTEIPESERLQPGHPGNETS